ncbi:hypothetical protein TSUD_318560 [Trifolium subterraneum]|uniref:Uncharacterized protein n=1 Tax=Trifolium subterraneum TaxID=3900 RepID=A0A2Z6P304_TRISU|nr:hypothetical protein TSUD_318560 [Trifolium subterraneum]
MPNSMTSFLKSDYRRIKKRVLRTICFIRFRNKTMHDVMRVNEIEREYAVVEEVVVVEQGSDGKRLEVRD